MQDKDTEDEDGANTGKNYYLEHSLTNITTLQPPFTRTQEQYAFIHDAVQEGITCGETQIPASGFKKAVSKMANRDTDTGLNSYEKQFEVSCCCKIITNVKVYTELDTMSAQSTDTNTTSKPMQIPALYEYGSCCLGHNKQILAHKKGGGIHRMY